MSHIKGGGRAAMSEDSEQDLVSLLRILYGEINAEELASMSEHERKREHRRFLKNIVERHDRQKLSEKVNQQSTKTKKEVMTSVPQKYKQPKGQLADGNEKVRIQLIEAIYGGSSSKKNDKNKKSKSGMKTGVMKIIVFKRSTTVEEVMTQGRSKLGMKKKPTRCFILDKKKKLEMDLVGDLRGLKDGDTLYLSSTAIEVPKKESEPSKPNAENDVPVIDPLDAVKEAYQSRSRLHKKNQETRVMHDYPCVGDHLNQLPPLSPERARLPAAACREEILKSLDESRVLIICGATGCGKSTSVPQFLLEGMKACGKDEETNILVTQPRRVAAISLAQRVAFEMGSTEPGTPGSLVGYNIRLDRAVSKTARIVYCTVGILLRMMVCPKEGIETNNGEGSTDKPPLSNISHLVIDEVHERDLNTDFVLTLTRSVLAINKQIRIILMSATTSAALFVNYFQKCQHINPPTVVSIPGRSFPVDIKWLNDCERFASAKISRGQVAESEAEEKFSSPGDTLLSPRATSKIDNHFVAKLIGSIVQKQQLEGKLNIQSHSPTELLRSEGAILVFLPGKMEIESLSKILLDDRSLTGNKDICKVLRLHSTIPRNQQQVVFKQVKHGMVKIVLATNIAETSITIPDVTHVIDTGRVKESRFNASTRIKELVTVWTSQASAKQRAGRAGRTSSGVCWRIYDETFFQQELPLYTPPEIIRTPLDELVLQVCLLYEQKRDEKQQQGHDDNTKFPNGVSPIKFLSRAPEPPPTKSLEHACDHLLEVGAVRISQESQVLYRLSPLGYHLSRLPMDTKVGKVLVVGCILQCIDPALTIAAALSNAKSCFPARWGKAAANDDWQRAVENRKRLVEFGFGGRDWRGGTVKGDLIASIAVYREWIKRKDDKERSSFCQKNALDNIALKEIHSLRQQFKDSLTDAGFITKESPCNNAKDDALLTSCCLVAGMYPNIATLMRPRKGGFKGGRLLTKDGDACRPSSSSFQAGRVKNAAESGKDAYVVYHSKNRSIGTSDRLGEIFISEVNFVSRFALLLFGGELTVEKNAIIIDGWLKFKVGDKGATSAVLIQALRKELDNVMLRHIMLAKKDDGENEKLKIECKQVIDVVRKLLSDE